MVSQVTLGHIGAVPVEEFLLLSPPLLIYAGITVRGLLASLRRKSHNNPNNNRTAKERRRWI